jgi:hypothetical protein
MARPLKYNNVDDIQRAIDEYFDNCDNRVQQVYSAKNDGVIEVIDPEPYTMSGLAYAMGIDRDTLLSYSKRDEFIGTIKRARDKVHSDVERRLMEGKGAVGAIFNLKNNFNWKDKTETDITSGNKPIPIMGAVSVYTDNSIQQDSQSNQEN